MGNTPKRNVVEVAAAEIIAAKRSKIERAAELRAHATAATAQLEAALGSALAIGVDHPVIEELRDAITHGKKIIARANELARRIPS